MSIPRWPTPWTNSAPKVLVQTRWQYSSDLLTWLRHTPWTSEKTNLSREWYVECPTTPLPIIQRRLIRNFLHQKKKKKHYGHHEHPQEQQLIFKNSRFWIEIIIDERRVYPPRTKQRNHHKITTLFLFL